MYLTTVPLKRGKFSLPALSVVTVVMRMACAVCIKTQSGECYWVSPGLIKPKL